MTGPYAARRPDRLGVHSLDHFQLAAPLEPARRFFEAFGLDVVTEGEHGLALRTFGAPHIWGRVRPGDRKQLDHIAFGAFGDDLDHLARRLEAKDIPLLSPPDGATAGLWFKDPHGVLLGVVAAPKVMPDAKLLAESHSVPGGARGAAMRGETAPVRPRRMSHALFFTPDIKTSVSFYTEILGLRVSDFPGPVAFLHGPHGSDHHLIAFAESSAGVGYHHSAWDVGSIDEIGLGAAQMAASGFDKGWGLGRHVLGSNYFHYVRDPWGSYAEYSFDIDHVPAEIDWPAGFPAPENSLYLWGPNVPEDFVINHEAADRRQGALT